MDDGVPVVRRPLALHTGLGLLRGDDAPELDLQPDFWTEQFGLSLKVAGFTPVEGAPEILDGAPFSGSALRWDEVRHVRRPAPPARYGTG